VPPFLPNELPVRARTRHHPIVLLRKTHKLTAVVLAVTVLASFFSFWGRVLLVAELAWILYWRWRIWRAEWILLTRKRIIRIQGIPETTSAEASLRLDRVSGLRLVESPMGKLLNYGTIELEAPGDHPDVRKLRTIQGAGRFYLILRNVIFNESERDPDDYPEDYITAPLPDLRNAPPHTRGGRHPRGRP
jgi:hypothetical protein